MDFRGLKMGVEIQNDIFWSEIEVGFGELGGTPHQEFPGVPPGFNSVHLCLLECGIILLMLPSAIY